MAMMIAFQMMTGFRKQQLGYGHGRQLALVGNFRRLQTGQNYYYYDDHGEDDDDNDLVGMDGILLLLLKLNNEHILAKGYPKIKTLVKVVQHKSVEYNGFDHWH